MRTSNGVGKVADAINLVIIFLGYCLRTNRTSLVAYLSLTMGRLDTAKIKCGQLCRIVDNLFRQSYY